MPRRRAGSGTRFPSPEGSTRSLGPPDSSPGCPAGVCFTRRAAASTACGGKTPAASPSRASRQRHARARFPCRSPLRSGGGCCGTGRRCRTTSWPSRSSRIAVRRSSTAASPASTRRRSRRSRPRARCCAGSSAGTSTRSPPSAPASPFAAASWRCPGAPRRRRSGRRWWGRARALPRASCRSSSSATSASSPSSTTRWRGWTPRASGWRWGCR